MITQKLFARRGLVLLIGMLLTLIVGMSVVIAQSSYTDGRLNEIANFGGDTLYCMDSSNNVTNDTSTFAYFQLLNIDGQPLWSLDKATVELGLGQIAIKPTAYLLGQGEGTYGPVYLYANAAQDGTPYFIFVGFDSWGKENRFTFYGCTPAGGALPATTPTTMPTTVPTSVG